MKVFKCVLIILVLCTGYGCGQNQVDEFLREGARYANNGQYDEAIGEFTKAIRINPHSAYAYYNRGVTYVDKGDFDQAILDY